MNGGVGGVNVLSAGTTGAGGLNVEVLWAELEVDLFRFGEYCHGDSRGVDSALGFSGWNPLNTMNTGLVFQEAENLFTCDLENDLFVSADVGRTAPEVLTFPAPAFSVALVELHQLTSKERGLVTAGARTDFQ